MKTIVEYLINKHIIASDILDINSEKDLVPGCYWQIEYDNVTGHQKAFGKLIDEPIDKNDEYYRHEYCVNILGSVYYHNRYISKNDFSNAFLTISDEEYKIAKQIEEYIAAHKETLKPASRIGEIKNKQFIAN